MRRFFSSQSGKQSELSGFNPAQQLRICCEILREEVSTEDLKTPFDLAVQYFTQWELQFSKTGSAYISVSRPPTADEQELVRTSGYPLLTELQDLGSSQEDFASFDALLKQQISRAVDVTNFTEDLESERTANVISWTATRFLFLLKKRGELEKVMVTLSCVVFLMMRYGEWMRER